MLCAFYYADFIEHPCLVQQEGVIVGGSHWTEANNPHHSTFMHMTTLPPCIDPQLGIDLQVNATMVCSTHDRADWHQSVLRAVLAPAINEIPQPPPNIAGSQHCKHGTIHQ